MAPRPHQRKRRRACEIEYPPNVSLDWAGHPAVVPGDLGAIISQQELVAFRVAVNGHLEATVHGQPLALHDGRHCLDRLEAEVDHTRDIGRPVEYASRTGSSAGPCRNAAPNESALLPLKLLAIGARRRCSGTRMLVAAWEAACGGWKN